MPIQPKSKMTAEEYLAGERASQVRHEFLDGAVFCMAGANRKHNQICSNLVRILGNRLSGRPCSVYSSDMRVKSEKSGKYSYPDVVVACEVERFEDENEDTLLNPIVIVEVLSDSTEAYDRGDKFFHYRQIDSFVEYVLVSQKSRHVERFVRQADNSWSYSELGADRDALELSSIGCRLSLKDLYDKVGLDRERPASRDRLA
jgi:Uma2 family endonuclease